MVEELSEKLDLIHSTICCHLHQLGTLLKFGKLITADCNEANQNVVLIFAFLSSHFSASFCFPGDNVHITTLEDKEEMNIV